MRAKVVRRSVLGAVVAVAVSLPSGAGAVEPSTPPSATGAGDCFTDERRRAELERITPLPADAAWASYWWWVDEPVPSGQHRQCRA